MADKYREVETGSLVFAYQVPDGEHDVAYNHFQEPQEAIGGAWIVSYARGAEEVIDNDSFDRDFERVAS
jgi:hypothetical protein